MKFVTVWVLFFLIAGCKIDGTHTGNPGKVPSSGSDAQLKPIFDLDKTICEKLDSCFTGVNIENCRESVLGNTSVPSELGYETGIQDLGQLKELLQSGTLSAFDSIALNSCLQGVRQLDCQDSSVMSAVQTEAEDPYANAHKLLGAVTSCRAVGAEGT